MIEPTELAICDVMRHSVHGLLSFQPRASDRSDNKIVRVRNTKRKVLRVNLDKCNWATHKEYKSYWRDFERP